MPLLSAVCARAVLPHASAASHFSVLLSNLCIARVRALRRETPALTSPPTLLQTAHEAATTAPPPSLGPYPVVNFRLFFSVTVQKSERAGLLDELQFRRTGEVSAEQFYGGCDTTDALGIKCRG